MYYSYRLLVIYNMTKKIFSVFVLGLIIGIIFTTLTQSVQKVEAARRRPSPTPTAAITPVPTITPIQNQVAGFYKNLTGAVLDNAFLAYHDFTGVNFTNASLRTANLQSSYMNNAILDGVDFTGSNMTGVDLTGTTLVGVKWYYCPEGDGMCGETVCPDGTTKLATQDAVCF